MTNATSTLDEDKKSYARILTSTSVIGGASVLNILIGLVRTKVVALLLGPAGVGLVGLLTALLSAAATVVQMGVTTVGTRQIAEAHAAEDGQKLAVARRALVLATVMLAAVGALGVWLLRDVLARYALRNPALADEVAWIAVGVALSVLAMGQTALLQGLRRIRAMAALQVVGGLATTAVGLPLVLAFGERAIPAFVVLVPLTSFLLGRWFVSRIPSPGEVQVRLPQLRAQWRVFLTLGLPMMGAGVAFTFANLWIQSEVKAQLGMAALGWFVAANTIAMQYVGLVLGAMAADYYPRLTGVIGDRQATRRLVNQQTEIALLLAGALVIAMFALAPWVIRLLYAPEFAPAAAVLRWQAAGTLLKVMSWPLGFILLAAGKGRTFFLSEVATLVLMAGATTLLLPRFGLEGAGQAYFLAYLFYLPMVLALAVRRIAFAWSRLVLLSAAAVASACGVVALVLWLAPAMAPAVGIVLSVAYGSFGLIRLQRLGVSAPLPGRLSMFALSRHARPRSRN